MEAFDGKGDPIEGVFSAEDVEARIKEAETKSAEALESRLSEYEAKLKEKDDEIDELSDKAADGGLFDEEHNWKRTRKALKDLKNDKKIMQKAFNDKLEELKGNITGTRLNDRIRALSNGSPELEAKIAVHYNSFGGTPKSEKEVQERLDKATILAGGSKANSNFLNSSAIRTGGSFSGSSSNVGKISDEAKGLAEKLGITNDDLKKTGAI